MPTLIGFTALKKRGQTRRVNLAAAQQIILWDVADMKADNKLIGFLALLIYKSYSLDQVIMSGSQTYQRPREQAIRG
jgi:hypothetical protein